MDGLVILGEVFEDGEQHVLLAQAGCVLDLQGFGETEQVRRRFCLEFGQMHSMPSILGQWAKGDSVRQRTSRGTAVSGFLVAEVRNEVNRHSFSALSPPGEKKAGRERRDATCCEG